VLLGGTSGSGSTGRGAKALGEVKSETLVFGARIFVGRVEGGGESDLVLFFVLRRGLVNWLPSSSAIEVSVIAVSLPLIVAAEVSFLQLSIMFILPQ
jgi:hypothetical protein